jgi:hypothetical protein
MDDITVVIGEIDHPERQQIGGAQHGIERRIEQYEIPEFSFGLKTVSGSVQLARA